ncbi:hypothetical protein JOQ06_015301 [Pogonophryne albipinna]|uniref:TNFR-Cys domain-containing protein n=1 Tax=Pogonophryne albipinna TaxID=1090488 RepID=A0AAD6AMR2_9TELE|nr:hypothetical protein JOQ06_015301 [Pogonophryne albipinna]
MKEILVLLVLLSGFTTKVCSQPYHADTDGNCLNSETEYLLEGTDLCCQKCPPGQKRKQKCSETNKTVCEECPTRQYMENWNYAPNCATCLKCKIGTGNSNVRCERCPNGTFSDTVSSVDHCQPHTNCYGRVVVKKGDATSDRMFFNPDAARFPPGVDANGNCESGDKINKGYLRETHPLMTLISDMESVRPQASVPPQSSSQPTSPQVISPLTTIPVVNITVNIGHGSCGTPNGTHIESQLQFRDEEELLSIPQQEAGKESLMSVQEDESYTHEESPA